MSLWQGKKIILRRRRRELVLTVVAAQRFIPFILDYFHTIPIWYSRLDYSLHFFIYLFFSQSFFLLTFPIVFASECIVFCMLMMFCSPDGTPSMHRGSYIGHEGCPVAPNSPATPSDKTTSTERWWSLVSLQFIRFALIKWLTFIHTWYCKTLEGDWNI